MKSSVTLPALYAPAKTPELTQPLRRMPACARHFESQNATALCAFEAAAAYRRAANLAAPKAIFTRLA